MNKKIEKDLKTHFEQFNGKPVLITGGNGFIGYHLANALTIHGASVSIIDQKHTNKNVAVKEFIGDLRDKTFINHSVRQCKPETIFHLAAFKERSEDISDFYTAIDINLVGSLNLFSVARELAELSSIVVIGTAEEYGYNSCPFKEEMREWPVSSYSFSKLCLTHLCEVLYALHKIPFVIARPTLTYGPGQDANMFLSALINTLLANKHFPMTFGQQTRDYIYIDDLINALMLLSQSSKAYGHIVNIGSGIPVKIIDIAVLVEKLLDRNGLIQPGKINYRTAEIMDYYTDNTNAQKLISWHPEVSLENGLSKTIDYYSNMEPEK